MLTLLLAAALGVGVPPPVLTGRLTYRSDGLRLGALVCRPDRQPGRALVNLVHGGLNSPPDLARCRRLARSGFVVAVSDLRGQNGSDGRPELCLGEVNDVRALSKLMPGLYRTDPRRVAYAGVSLGGCVALKAAALDPATRAAAALVSPTDFAQEWRNIRATRPDALARWTGVLGGTPDELPHLYRLRQPLTAAARIRAPLFVGAAGDDPLIPIGQACALREVRRQAGRAVSVVRQNRDGTPSATPARPDRGCPDERPGATFPSGGDQDVFMLVTDLPHRSSPRMWLATEQFLARHLAPPNAFQAFWLRLFGR